MTSQQGEAPRRDRWVAMFVLLIASFMNMIDVTIVNVAMPRLQGSFHATSSQIEWVVAAYILVFALGLLPFGRLGDIYGRRRIFLIGVGVFTMGSMLCGLAPSMGALIAARVVQGFGGAMMIPQTLAIAQVLFPPQERAAAFSLFGLVAGLAAVAGPVAGGLLIHADFFGLDWRPIFLINIPIGALAILGALRFIPRIPGAPQLSLDWGGVALASLTILLLIIPLIEGREAGWPAWVFVMLVAAIPAAVLFILWERRQEARGLPELLPVRLMTNRNFLIGTAMSTMLFSGVPGFFLVLAIYLQSGNGLEPLQSGLTTVPFSVGVLVASAVSGRLGIRWPRRRITAGALMLATTMVWLRFVVEGVVPPLDRLQFLPPLFLGGLGLGIAIGPMFQTVLANVPPRDAGSGSGALQSLQQIGGALGVALMGQIFFSRLADGLQAGGEKLPVFAHALTGALLYNTAAFLLVAGIVRLLPRPQSGGVPRPAPAAEV